MKLVRDRRIKTEAQQPNKKMTKTLYKPEKPFQTDSPKIKSPSFLSKIFGLIKTEKKYDEMTKGQIEEERRFLILKVEQLHETISEVTRRKTESRQRDGRSVKDSKNGKTKERRSVLPRSMGLDLESLSKECVSNRHYLAQLEKELREDLEKLQQLSNNEGKLECERLIEEAHQEVRSMQRQINKQKKNKTLREKEMTVNRQDDHEMLNLQKEQLILTKKKVFLEGRIATTEQEVLESQVNYQLAKEDYQQIKGSVGNLHEDQKRDSQHLKIIYNTSKRKLQLLSKRRDREDDLLKKKYYALLLQCDQAAQHADTYHQQLQQLLGQIERKNNQIEEMHMLHETVRGGQKKKGKSVISGASGVVFGATDVLPSRTRLSGQIISNRAFFSEKKQNTLKGTKEDARTSKISKKVMEELDQLETSGVREHNFKMELIRKEEGKYKAGNKPRQEITAMEDYPSEESYIQDFQVS